MINHEMTRSDSERYFSLTLLAILHIVIHSLTGMYFLYFQDSMSSAESEVVSQGGSSPPLPDCTPIPRPVPVNISTEVKGKFYFLVGYGTAQ